METSGPCVLGGTQDALGQGLCREHIWMGRRRGAGWSWVGGKQAAQGARASCNSCEAPGPGRARVSAPVDRQAAAEHKPACDSGQESGRAGRGAGSCVSGRRSAATVTPREGLKSAPADTDSLRLWPIPPLAAAAWAGTSARSRYCRGPGSARVAAAASSATSGALAGTWVRGLLGRASGATAPRTSPRPAGPLGPRLASASRS